MHPRGVILGAQRRVRRLRDSLTPGRADPRQAERAQRRTEREREREREREEAQQQGEERYCKLLSSSSVFCNMLNEKVSLSVSSVVKVCVALVCEEVDPNSYQGNSSVSNFFFFFFFFFLFNSRYQTGGERGATFSLKC